MRLSFLPSSLAMGGLSCPFHSAKHIGKAQVLALEADNDLVADLGNQHEATVFAGHGHRQPCPVAVGRLAMPGVAYLDPAKAFGVLVLSHESDRNALHKAAAGITRILGRLAGMGLGILALRRIRVLGHGFGLLNP